MTTSTVADVEDAVLLLHRIANGEHKAFELLYTRLRGFVLSIAVSLLNHSHDDAEDVVQDVFLALWRCPPRAKYGNNSLLAWLSSTARRRCLLHLRCESKARAIARNPLHRSSSAPALAVEQIIERECREQLETEIPRAGRKYQRILVLTYYESLRPLDIAQRLGMPVVTVRQRLGFATRDLRLRFSARFARREQAGFDFAMNGLQLKRVHQFTRR